MNNRLLLALPLASWERLCPSLREVELVRGQLIDHVGGRVEQIYFPNRGFVSSIKTMSDGRSVEVGGVGIEGVTDAQSVLGGERAVFEALVQIPGEAFRIGRESLRQLVEIDTALRDLIRAYIHFSWSALAQIAACNRLHSLEERCCRWLPVGHDNALSDRFPLTHEFLAEMIGGTRASVSIAARMLKNAGLIDYVRGEVSVLDRAGLEEASCECYAATRQELNSLFAG